MKVFILRYDCREEPSSGVKPINDTTAYSKCFHSVDSAFYWVERNRMKLKWASCHRIRGTFSTTGMFEEDLHFFRSFDEDGGISARIPSKMPYYEYVLRKKGETHGN